MAAIRTDAAVAGVVFAPDGILIGASDTAFLMRSMLSAAFLVCAPVARLSLAFDWRIVGVWIGLVGLIGRASRLSEHWVCEPLLGRRRLGVTA